MKDLTEIAIVLDRSGSMAKLKDDMEGGLWNMILEQHKVPGACRVSLYRFDDEFEVAFEGKSSGDVKREDILLVPRGWTALNDAIVKSLSAIEARVLAESDPPEKVVIVVITDGQENASKENKREDAKNIIERATDKLGWKFLYLAANPGGFAEGKSYTAGVMRGAQAIQYTMDSMGVKNMNARNSEAIRSYRLGETNDVELKDKK